MPKKSHKSSEESLLIETDASATNSPTVSNTKALSWIGIAGMAFFSTGINFWCYSDYCFY